MFKMGIIYSLALLILNLNYRLGILILAQMSSASEVGIYTVGVGIVEMIWVIPAVLTKVNFTYSALANDIYEHAQKTAKLLRIVLLVGTVACTALFFTVHRLVELIYGAEYLRSATVIQVLLPGVWGLLIFKVLNSDLAGRGRPRIALYVFSATLVINILANFYADPSLRCGWRGLCFND